MIAHRFASVLTLLAALPAAAQQPAYEMQRVADGIYTIFRTTDPYTPADGNATVIINETDVVVVDANLAPSSAREMVAEIRKLTPNPVRYVINTHWHDDHVLGNQVYLEAFPGVEFIAHARTRTAVLGQVAPSLVKNAVEYPKTFAQIEKRLAEASGAERHGVRSRALSVAALSSRHASCTARESKARGGGGAAKLSPRAAACRRGPRDPRPAPRIAGHCASVWRLCAVRQGCASIETADFPGDWRVRRVRRTDCSARSRHTTIFSEVP